MFAKRWTATCDRDGCTTAIVLDRIPQGDKWDYGRALNDAGWQAAPAIKETYCPEHTLDHDVFVAEIESRHRADREKWIHQEAEAIADAISDRAKRRTR